MEYYFYKNDRYNNIAIQTSMILHNLTSVGTTELLLTVYGLSCCVKLYIV